MRILCLVPDAFGGRGGIAAFDRQMLEATCDFPGMTEVVALPRLVVDEIPPLPPTLRFHTGASRGRIRYLAELARVLARGRYDAIICGHANLLPLAVLAAARFRAPLLLVGYGVEVWRPRGRMFERRLLRRVDWFVAISEVTLDRFLAWAPVSREQTAIVPPSVDASRFGPGPKPRALVERYGLEGRVVLLTLARLSSAERYKGIDEVLELLPELAQHVPDVAYLIVGDGDDRERLAAKAARLGVAGRVVFAGHVSDSEKAEHYRVADAFVMPGRGEGFGIVYLEAAACGIPVVASRLDASREAVRNGELGAVVDPNDGAELRNAILAALSTRERSVPAGLEYFSVGRFRQRWHAVLARLLAARPVAAST